MYCFESHDTKSHFWCDCIPDVQGEHSDVMYVVESGVITCHVDFLRLHHRMRLPAVSHEMLAVAPVRYSPAAAARY